MKYLNWRCNSLILCNWFNGIYAVWLSALLAQNAFALFEAHFKWFNCHEQTEKKKQSIPTKFSASIKRIHFRLCINHSLFSSSVFFLSVCVCCCSQRHSAPDGIKNEMSSRSYEFGIPTWNVLRHEITRCIVFVCNYFM